MADLSNGTLARIFSLEWLVGVAATIGVLYAGLAGDISANNKIASDALKEARTAELHSIQRAEKDEKRLQELGENISEIRANQAQFSTAIKHMTENQKRILDKLDRMDER